MNPHPTSAPAAAAPPATAALDAARELLVERFMAFCADPDSAACAADADLALHALDVSIAKTAAS